MNEAARLTELAKRPFHGVLADEEWFGPLLQLHFVPDWEQAIGLAAATRFGLAAGLVGGSETMLGAPILAGTAALCMGSGLVQVAMPRDTMLMTSVSASPLSASVLPVETRSTMRIDRPSEGASSIAPLSLTHSAWMP